MQCIAKTSKIFINTYATNLILFSSLIYAKETVFQHENSFRRNEYKHRGGDNFIHFADEMAEISNMTHITEKRCQRIYQKIRNKITLSMVPMSKDMVTPLNTMEERYISTTLSA